ncbi:hypothetical protein ACIO53_31695 [Streptomyces sp. NPDC087305]
MTPLRREAHRGSLREEVDTGIDRLMCFQQVGAIPHEWVLSALTPILD